MRGALRGLARNDRRLAGLSRVLLAAMTWVFLSVWTASAPGQGGGQGATGAVPASRAAKNLAVIPIRGEITGVTALSVQRRIAEAEKGGADAIVIELDTPGGEVGAVLEICNAIKGSAIANSVAWVHPDAYSGGAIIALACREIVASDPATLGDAKPIQLNSFGMLNSMPDDAKQKILPPLLAEVVDSAQRRNQAVGAYQWDELLVQAIVASDAELWYIENTRTGLRMCVDRAEFEMLFPDAPVSQPLLQTATVGSADAPAPFIPKDDGAVDQASGSEASESPSGAAYTPASPSLAALGERIEQGLDRPSLRPGLDSSQRGEWRLLGKVSSGNGPVVLKGETLRYFGLSSATIKTDDELKAFFGAENLTRLEQSWSEDLVHFMSNMWVRGLLIVVFLLALFVEMTHPGVMLPGGIAFAALVALLAPPLLVGMANWWEVAAILAGILLILLEIFVIPGFGVFGVLGIVALFVGLVGTFVPNEGGLFPDSPQAKNDMLYGLVTVVLALATTVVGVFFFVRHLGTIPLLNRLVLTAPPPMQASEEGSDEMLRAMRRPGPTVRPGMEGVAMTTLRPSGRVQIGETYLDVVADRGYIGAGARVRVTAVDGIKISVEPIDDGTAESSPGPSPGVPS